MIPPLAILVGVGVGQGVSLIRGSGSLPTTRAMRVAVAIGLAVLVGWYATAAPALAAQSGQLLKVTADTDVDPAVEQYADAVAVIRTLTAPTDFVVTDHPYLTFLAARLVPPLLVDTSRSRIRSRSLRGAEAIAQATPYDPTLVVLWADRLRGLSEFKRWVEEKYRLVKVYNRRNDLDRGIYVPETRDPAEVRALLGEPGRRAAAGRLRRRPAAGQRAGRSDGDPARRGRKRHPGMGSDASAPCRLPRADGSSRAGRAGLGPAAGVARRRQRRDDRLGGRSVAVPEHVRADRFDGPAGEYEVVVSVYDSRARQKAKLSDGPDEIVVGRLTVR